MIPEEKTKEIVRQKLTMYLESKGLRKTPERYAILDKIYSTNEHFDVDSLYEIMAKSKYRVSKATVYNSIDLFVNAGLVRKHQFGHHPAQYEKAYNTVSHHHLICTLCGKVQEVKDQDLLNVLANKKFGKFSTTYYTLYVYGICNRCAQAEKKKAIHK
ncbi:Fur family transcriptional regulator [Coprobacter tertius]|uniref:Ferric uptake regulation protein n=1 Tax=Coprobacter tertius TaxID=2944915 RepID=A0ABT1MF53_9BACT|nr:transcriptional repressor [Coprobacter tertius]MCP9611260.1 transcriptional repressor [Coprobacter tertius]